MSSSEIAEISELLLTVVMYTSIFLSTYCAPATIAFFRGKNDKWKIFWLNFLFGWTVVGWAVALVWALFRDDQK